MFNDAMSKVRDYIALIMTVAILGLVGLKITLPDRIWDIYMMVIAFFFGSKQVNGDTPKPPATPPSPLASQKVD